MSEPDPDIIEHSVEKAHIWLKEVAAEMGDEDRQSAYRALRAVLHTLRDRLTVDVAVKLAAQLPTLIRGIYYEDWDPSRTPLPIAVARVLRAHVSPGEIEGVLAVVCVPGSGRLSRSELGPQGHLAGLRFERDAGVLGCAQLTAALDEEQSSRSRPARRLLWPRRHQKQASGSSRTRRLGFVQRERVPPAVDALAISVK